VATSVKWLSHVGFHPSIGREKGTAVTVRWWAIGLRKLDSDDKKEDVHQSELCALCLSRITAIDGKNLTLKPLNLHRVRHQFVRKPLTVPIRAGRQSADKRRNYLEPWRSTFVPIESSTARCRSVLRIHAPCFSELVPSWSLWNVTSTCHSCGSGVTQRASFGRPAPRVFPAILVIRIPLEKYSLFGMTNRSDTIK
jgi:hypothetical protein